MKKGMIEPVRVLDAIVNGQPYLYVLTDDNSFIFEYSDICYIVLGVSIFSNRKTKKSYCKNTALFANLQKINEKMY